MQVLAIEKKERQGFTLWEPKQPTPQPLREEVVEKEQDTAQLEQTSDIPVPSLPVREDFAENSPERVGVILAELFTRAENVFQHFPKLKRAHKFLLTTALIVLMGKAVNGGNSRPVEPLDVYTLINGGNRNPIVEVVAVSVTPDPLEPPQFPLWKKLGEIYIVQEGDWLYKIARESGILSPQDQAQFVKDVKQLNNLTNEHLIYTDQVLRMPKQWQTK